MQTKPNSGSVSGIWERMNVSVRESRQARERASFKRLEVSL